MFENFWSSLKSSIAQKPNDYILTGLPRSGTTLTCKILTEQDNIVALNEPIKWKGIGSKNQGVDLIKKSFKDFRRSLHRTGMAPSRVRNGKITDNHFVRTLGSRDRVVKRETIHFNKNLDQNFKLFLKHNSTFTLLLEDLQKIYPCYAIVRNPLAVLGSWNSVTVPVSRGEMRHLDAMDPVLASRLSQAGSVTDRQIIILDYYFTQYIRLPSENVIKYEELISSQGQKLSKLTGSSVKYKSLLASKNVSSIYDIEKLKRLAEVLIHSDGSFWKFYEKEQIHTLLIQYSSDHI